jgi:hypothetical protein
MPISLYMDHHIPKAITTGLRLRHVDVLTADEDGAAQLSDPELLDRATELGLVLFSQDDDLLAEANRRQTVGITFGGVDYARQVRVPIGICVLDLELITMTADPGDLTDTVLFLPL